MACPGRARWAAILFAGLLGSCGDESAIEKNSDIGKEPKLPPPQSSWIPTVNIAPAKGWPADRKPMPAEGLEVAAFANNLDHPRWLYVLPNGDVLVAESNAPARSDAPQGLRGWIMGLVMARAGAGVKSADRITILRDADGDGVAEIARPFATNLHSPFGMALIGETLYVANTDAVVKFKFIEGQLQAEGPPVKVADLPAGPINHHWTKNIIAARDGTALYATVGSNSNVAENGMENEERRAAILKIDPKSGATSVFASGLRNPNGLAWEPVSGALWTTVNERDELGSDLVPDYMTSVREGGFYGWPYSYYGANVDERVTPPRPDLVAKALKPDYALGAHTASLGLAFSDGRALPRRFAAGAFVGQHGSWNRKPKSGYKVIFVPFSGGLPSGLPQDVLTGFLSDGEEAYGRPVGVAIDRTGALLVADDVGNTVWRVTVKDGAVSRNGQ